MPGHRAPDVRARGLTLAQGSVMTETHSAPEAWEMTLHCPLFKPQNSVSLCIFLSNTTPGYLKYYRGFRCFQNVKAIAAKRLFSLVSKYFIKK